MCQAPRWLGDSCVSEWKRIADVAEDVRTPARAAERIGGVERRAIVVVSYRHEWRGRFRQHARRIAAALGDAALRVEHIGSTAVRGFAAKPIVDMLLVVADSSNEDAYAPAMRQCGCELRVREPDFEEHRMFRTPERDVHVHVLSDGSREIERYLRFRDALRRDAGLRLRDGTLKQALACRDWPDMDSYAAAKTEFIESTTVAACLDCRGGRAGRHHGRSGDGGR